MEAKKVKAVFFLGHRTSLQEAELESRSPPGLGEEYLLQMISTHLEDVCQYQIRSKPLFSCLMDTASFQILAEVSWKTFFCF